MILLKAEHNNIILKHGEEDYPYECCGLMLGHIVDKLKIVEEIFPISNAREEASKRNRFLITPEEFSHGENKARQNDMEVVGFYHSHPDHRAVPSSFDLEHAWPIYSYVIVSVIQSKAAIVLSWELEDERTEFKSEKMLIGE
jgi:proteasome lid subunit RPN8/RPN11